jgi:hypothetical protein
MGHVISIGLGLSNKQSMYTLKSLVSKGNVTNREKLHALAIKELSDG